MDPSRFRRKSAWGCAAQDNDIRKGTYLEQIGSAPVQFVADSA
jgi:hypothetical protein